MKRFYESHARAIVLERFGDASGPYFIACGKHGRFSESKFKDAVSRAWKQVERGADHCAIFSDASGGKVAEVYAIEAELGRKLADRGKVAVLREAA